MVSCAPIATLVSYSRREPRSGPAASGALGICRELEGLIHAKVAERSSSYVCCLSLCLASGHACFIARTGGRRCFHHHGASGAAGLRSAALPDRRIPLDPRLLGLWSCS